MKIVLHFGMPKTGTSSIQNTLAKNTLPGFVYLPWRSPNHTGLLALLFEDRPHTVGAFSLGPDPTKRVQSLREVWLPKTEAFLAAERDETVLISGERGFAVPKVAKQRIRDFLGQYTDDLQVYVYIRSPVSYIQSALQQNVKTGLGSFELRDIWPHYRRRIEELESVFGREAVNLVHFDRQTLADGDVVSDFCARIGIPVSKIQIERANESISLTTLGLMHAYRTLTRNDPIHKAMHSMRIDAHLVHKLEQAGAGKFEIAKSWIDPLLAEQAADIAWIENRMGHAILDAPSVSPEAIGSFDDLMAIARRQTKALKSLILESFDTEGTEDNVLRSGLLMLRGLAV